MFFFPIGLFPHRPLSFDIGRFENHSSGHSDDSTENPQHNKLPLLFSSRIDNNPQ